MLPTSSSHALRHATALLALCLGLAACAGAGQQAPVDPGQDSPGAGDEDDTSGAESVSDGDDAPSPLHIVATTSILGDVVASIVGDDARVDVLMPPGTDPHGYEPSARDGQILREADLVVSNGLGLEESLIGVLESVRQEGGRVFSLAEELDPIPLGESAGDGHAHGGDDSHDDDGHDESHAEDGHDEGHADEGDDEGPLDPHVWFDPVRMADGVILIGEEIMAVEGSSGEESLRRAGKYADELLELHEDLEEVLNDVPEDRRRIVTNHDSLGYFADRYGFDVVATVIPGTGTQTENSAAGFAELVDLVERSGVRVVFAENTDTTALAEQLRAELGRSDIQLEVVRIYTDALGRDGSGAESYTGLLRTTAELIAEALTSR